MCEGGIYDHLGGGFSRYSVDERWLVPHFEKMLYDNALLLELLGIAYQRSGNALFRSRAAETVAWLTREMTTAEGAFCASLDADSEGEEGKFYVWSLAEIEAVLADRSDAAFFAAHYDVTPEGNFEGPQHPQSPQALTAQHGRRETGSRRCAKNCSPRARARVRPGLDDKVLADWNGLMIAALVNAGLAFDQPHWLELAARAFLFIDARMAHGDRLGHSWREGKLLLPGLASDHAAMIRAALALHEATADHAYLERALAWQGTLDRHYANPATGGYFLTADDAKDLVVRPSATTDDATPNPNALAAQNLIRLAVFTGQHAWRDKADRLFDGIVATAGDNLFAPPRVAQRPRPALARRRDRRGRKRRARGHPAYRRPQAPLPRSHRAACLASTLPASHPAQQKINAAAQSAAFVCIGETCSLPVTEPDTLAETVSAVRPRAPSG